MAATLSPPRLLPSGDSAITVEFSRNIDDAANRRVLALDRTLAREPVSGVTETVPTYRSLLVHYDPTQIDFDTLGKKLVELAQRPVPPTEKTRRWRIPVVYGGEHGIDLEDVAKSAGHHARRNRGAAHRRRLPRRHDRIYARLVLSQRPPGFASYAAATKPAPVDALPGRFRSAACRPACNVLPVRAAGICWAARLSEPTNCIAIRSSSWNPVIA